MIKNIDENDPVLPAGKYNFWRYFVITILIIGLTLATQFLLILFASLFEGNFDVMNYRPITLLWVTMLPFAGMLIFLIFGIRVLHHQTIRSIFTQKVFFNKNLLFKSFLLWFFLSAAADIILAIIQPDNYSLTFVAKSFFPYMILAFGLILMQITAEEILFRHYFLHGFFRLFRNRWVAIVAQALLFGILHGANPEVSMYGMLTTMPFYIGIGLILGWLTLKSKGLEIALGLHLANNIYATAMVTFEGSAIPSPAIFTIKQYQPEIGLVVFFITAIIFGLVITPEIKKRSKIEV